MKSEHKHIDIERLGLYISNRLTTEEENNIQEHLIQCPECRKKLKNLRALHNGFFKDEENVAVKNKSRITAVYFKVAASLIVLAGISFFVYTSVNNGADKVLTPLSPQERVLENPVFSVDSLSHKDTVANRKILYKEEYHYELKKN